MTSSVTLSLSDGTGTPGQTVEVPFDLTSKGTASPATFQTDLSFDQQKITFTSARAGEQMILANKNLSSTILANGEVRLLAFGINQASIANGVIAYATFTLNPQFLTGGTVVTLKNCSSSSGQGSAIATGCTAGVIKTFTCDINADGAVNVIDLQLLINEVLGRTPPVHDLNHDGAVNVADVQKAINAALGRGCPY